MNRGLVVLCALLTACRNEPDWSAHPIGATLAEPVHLAGTSLSDVWIAEADGSLAHTFGRAEWTQPDVPPFASVEGLAPSGDGWVWAVGLAAGDEWGVYLVTSDGEARDRAGALGACGTVDVAGSPRGVFVAACDPLGVQFLRAQGPLLAPFARFDDAGLVRLIGAASAAEVYAVVRVEGLDTVVRCTSGECVALDVPWDPEALAGVRWSATSDDWWMWADGVAVHADGMIEAAAEELSDPTPIALPDGRLALVGASAGGLGAIAYDADGDAGPMTPLAECDGCADLGVYVLEDGIALAVGSDGTWRVGSVEVLESID